MEAGFGDCPPRPNESPDDALGQGDIVDDVCMPGRAAALFERLSVKKEEVSAEAA